MDNVQDTAKKSSVTSSATIDTTKAQNAAQAAIDASGLQASVTYIDLASGKGFSIAGSSKRVSASMIKLVILGELLQEAAGGSVSLNQQVTIGSGQVVGGTGVIQNMNTPVTLPLSDVATYMISNSDNTATNVIIDMVGMDAVNAWAAKTGLAASSLNRRMMDTSAIANGVENYMSTDDAAKVLQMVYSNTFVNAQMSSFALDALKQQAIDQGVADGVPSGTVVAHKTGSLANVENDAAIVYAPSPYVLVVMADGGDSSQDLALIAAISEAVYANR